MEATRFDRLLAGSGDDDVVRAEYGSSDDEPGEVEDDSDTEES
jgi:hypothetical protein